MKPKVYIVEGRNDVTRLKQVFPDINVLSVNGSAVDKNILKILERIKDDYEIIIVTDPDYPGEKIRKTIAGKISNVSHIFVDKSLAHNKNHTKIGIEHMSDEELKKAFKYKVKNSIVKSDLKMSSLYKLKLIGHENSAELRDNLSRKLKIGHVNGKALLERLIMLGLDKKELELLCKEL